MPTIKKKPLFVRHRPGMVPMLEAIAISRSVVKKVEDWPDQSAVMV